MAAHADDDPLVGEPLCADCYDYDHHVLWQWWAPELWRRFHNHPAPGAGPPPGGGVVSAVRHHHPSVREGGRVASPGRDPLTRSRPPRRSARSRRFSAAPAHVTAGDLEDAIRSAAASVRYDAPLIDPWVVVGTLRFGAQVDVKPITSGCWTDTKDGLTAEQVAGYLAKYATKSASDTADARPYSLHLHRLRRAVLDLSGRAAVRWGYYVDQPYALLSRWVHMLGFRGHFSPSLAATP